MVTNLKDKTSNYGQDLKTSQKQRNWTLYHSEGLGTDQTSQVQALYGSVSQPPGRRSVPGPGINYTGPREVNIL
jgi:hypothetical protein